MIVDSSIIKMNAINFKKHRTKGFLAVILLQVQQVARSFGGDYLFKNAQLEVQTAPVLPSLVQMGLVNQPY